MSFSSRYYSPDGVQLSSSSSPRELGMCAQSQPCLGESQQNNKLPSAMAWLEEIIVFILEYIDTFNNQISILCSELRLRCCNFRRLTFLHGEVADGDDDGVDSHQPPIHWVTQDPSPPQEYPSSSRRRLWAYDPRAQVSSDPVQLRPGSLPRPLAQSPRVSCAYLPHVSSRRMILLPEDVLIPC